MRITQCLLLYLMKQRLNPFGVTHTPIYAFDSFLHIVCCQKLSINIAPAVMQDIFKCG